MTDQSEAEISAEPTTTDVNNILNNNGNIKTAFTNNDPSPLYFGIGELGGAYSSFGFGPETDTSSINMTVDLTKAGTLHDLVIGFYSGTATGTIASDPAFSMTLDVKINGVDSPFNPPKFTSVAAANSYFGNHAVDFGALSGSTLQLDISLSVTESSKAGIGGGYDFGMLIGDPAPAGDAAAHHNMVAAISSFGARGGDSSGHSDADPYADHRTMLAGHSA